MNERQNDVFKVVLRMSARCANWDPPTQFRGKEWLPARPLQQMGRRGTQTILPHKIQNFKAENTKSKSGKYRYSNWKTKIIKVDNTKIQSWKYKKLNWKIQKVTENTNSQSGKVENTK